MVCTSCKTSYNVLSWLGTGLNCAYEGGWAGGLIVDIRRGVMQKKEPPDFRIPEVGISGLCTTTSANTLIAVVHLTVNIFRQLPAFTCHFHCSITFCHFIHSLLMTHFTSNYYYTYYQRWHGLAAYSPAVIHYNIHFLFTIITHVGGSNGVNTGAMKHWLPFLSNTDPI